MEVQNEVLKEVTDRSSLCNVEDAYGFNILHLTKENAF